MRCFPACLPSAFFSKGELPRVCIFWLDLWLGISVQPMQINWLRERGERERGEGDRRGAPGYDFRLGKQKCVFPTKRTVHNNNKTHLGPTRRGLTWAQLSFHIVASFFFRISFFFFEGKGTKFPKIKQIKQNSLYTIRFAAPAIANLILKKKKSKKKTKVPNGCQLSLLLDFGIEREAERQGGRERR